MSLRCTPIEDTSFPLPRHSSKGCCKGEKARKSIKPSKPSPEAISRHFPENAAVWHENQNQTWPKEPAYWQKIPHIYHNTSKKHVVSTISCLQIYASSLYLRQNFFNCLSYRAISSFGRQHDADLFFYLRRGVLWRKGYSRQRNDVQIVYVVSNISRLFRVQMIFFQKPVEYG